MFYGKKLIQINLLCSNINVSLCIEENRIYLRENIDFRLYNARPLILYNDKTNHNREGNGVQKLI